MAPCIMYHLRLLTAALALAYALQIHATDTLVGCFKDGPRRVLPTQVSGSGQLTQSICSEAAKARGQPLYGLKNGNECWIGQSAAPPACTCISSAAQRHCISNADQHPPLQCSCYQHLPSCITWSTVSVRALAGKEHSKAAIVGQQWGCSLLIVMPPQVLT